MSSSKKINKNYNAHSQKKKKKAYYCMGKYEVGGKETWRCRKWSMSCYGMEARKLFCKIVSKFLSRYIKYSFGYWWKSQHLCLHFFFFFLNFFCEARFCGFYAFVGSVHYLRNPQTSFFSKTFIKNWSHGTIHTFKNYFVIVFLVFSKISSIQTYPKSLLVRICYNCTLIYFVHHLRKYPLLIWSPST